MSQSYDSEKFNMALRSNQPALLQAPIAPEPSGFTVSDLFAILFRHITVFLLVFLGIAAIGTTYILGSHKKYVSKMEILVQNGRSDTAISASRNEAAASLQQVTEEDLYSQVELISSTDVLDEVVDPGWSSIPVEKRPVEAIQKHAAAVGALQKSLLVTPIRKAWLFTVEATTLDPYKSTNELRLLLAAFLKEKRKINNPGSATQMFTQEAESYRKQWQDAEHALSDYQQNNQLITIKDQEEMIQKQILSTDNQLQEANVALAEVDRKIQSDNSQIATLPQRQVTRETNIPAVGSLDTMHSKLSELNLERTELLTTYKPTDRLIKQVDEKIAAIQRSLDDSRSLYSKENSTDVNPTWQFANQDLNEAVIRRAGLAGRQKALTVELNSLQQRLSTAAGGTQTFSTLQHKATELEENYKLYAQKRDEARMTAVMDENQLLNVAVVQNPTFSLGPVRPRPLIDGVLTFITATFFGLFAVFLAHNANNTISSEQDLQGVSALPTLASVPMLREPLVEKESA